MKTIRELEYRKKEVIEVIENTNLTTPRDRGDVRRARREIELIDYGVYLREHNISVELFKSHLHRLELTLERLNESFKHWIPDTKQSARVKKGNTRKLYDELRGVPELKR